MVESALSKRSGKMKQVFIALIVPLLFVSNVWGEGPLCCELNGGVASCSSAGVMTCKDGLPSAECTCEIQPIARTTADVGAVGSSRSEPQPEAVAPTESVPTASPLPSGNAPSCQEFLIIGTSKQACLRFKATDPSVDCSCF